MNEPKYTQEDLDRAVAEERERVVKVMMQRLDKVPTLHMSKGVELIDRDDVAYNLFNIQGSKLR